MAKTKPLKVGYIMSRFPKITETFVLYEVIELLDRGVEVYLFPLLKEPGEVKHEAVTRVMPLVTFHPYVSMPIILANLHYLLRRPFAYIGLWFEVFFGNLKNLKFLLKGLAILPKSARFAYEMEQKGITHVHAHFATHPVIAALAVKRLSGIGYSFTAHGSDLHKDQTMLAQKIDASDMTITISDYNVSFIEERCGRSFPDKIKVVRCGVDAKFFKARENHQRSGPFFILCIAALREVKGHRHLLDACAILKQRGIDFVCHLAGDGPLREEIEATIKNLGLEDSFVVHGSVPRSKIASLIASADVVTLNSIIGKSGNREGIPVSLMEAMACCVPVVSTKQSGIPELVKEGGILTPPGDAEAIANAFEKIHNDPNLAEEMGRAGRAIVLEEYDLSKNAAKLAALFEECNS